MLTPEELSIHILKHYSQEDISQENRTRLRKMITFELGELHKRLSRAQDLLRRMMTDNFSEGWIKSYLYDKYGDLFCGYCEEEFQKDMDEISWKTDPTWHTEDCIVRTVLDYLE